MVSSVVKTDERASTNKNGSEWSNGKPQLGSKDTGCIFSRFNKTPFEYETRHADQIIELEHNQPGQSYLTSLSSPPDSLSADRLADEVHFGWISELQSAGPARATLARVLLRLLARDLLKTLAMSICLKVLPMVATLELTRRLLLLVESKDQMDQLLLPPGNGSITHLPHWLMPYDPNDRLMLAIVACLLLCIFSYSVLDSLTEFQMEKCGLKSQLLTSLLVARKTSRLHVATASQQSSGLVLGLLSNQANVIGSSSVYLTGIISGPILMVALFSWLIYTQDAYLPALVMVAPMLLLSAHQLFQLGRYKRLKLESLQETQRRAQTSNMFVATVKLVKMLSWEHLFRSKIEYSRDHELNSVTKVAQFAVRDQFNFQLTIRFVPALGYLAYIWLYGHMDQAALFIMALVIVATGYDICLLLPKGLRGLRDLMEACTEVNKYLLLPEHQRRGPTTVSTRPRGPPRPEKESLVSIANMSLAYGPARGSTLPAPQFGAPIIEKLSIEMRPGELILVTGPVGSGKSSLLRAILGELQADVRPDNGGWLRVRTSAQLAYASQEPFILADTFRNNILLGRRFRKDRYQRVIRSCALSRDIELLPEGENTQLGNGGTNLSGGQRARLNLARAIYSEAQIYLLDDPLAAVDSAVAAHLFSRCIRPLADEGNLVILATHQLALANQASQMILLEPGQPALVRTPSQLTTTCFENRRQVAGSGQLTQLERRISESLNSSQELNNLQLLPSEDQGKCSQVKPFAEQPIERPKWSFFTMGFNRLDWFLLLAFGFTAGVLSGLSHYYLRIWSELLQQGHLAESSELTLWALNSAITLTLALMVMLFARQVSKGLTSASRKLHKLLLDSLFGATMSFYDRCPLGELNARFASDFTRLDHVLPPVLIQSSCDLLNYLATFVALAVLAPLYTIPTLLVTCILACPLIRRHRKLARLSELADSLRGAAYSNLATTFASLDTVRSSPDYVDFQRVKFHLHRDRYTSMLLLRASCNARFAMLAKSIGFLYPLIIFYALIGRQWRQLDAGICGTDIRTSLSLLTLLPLTIRFGSMAIELLSSVDSICQLLRLPTDRTEIFSPESSHGQTKPIQWPAGELTFDRVTLRYAPGARPILNQLTFCIRAGERIGVVGRTGAGKSSIISALFRLYPFEGSICIDATDICSLEVQQLRASLGVIPQDPVLFGGSLRENLDPFGQLEDQQLWQALEQVQLVKDNKLLLFGANSTGLEQQISEGGRNLSVGQRQLVCLARAILRAPKVLLVDEATASVDLDTDALIQATIRRQFADCTVITIAHRLDTVLDCHRVLVLDAGRLVEFDTIENLMQKPSGHFRALVDKMSSPLEATAKLGV